MQIEELSHLMEMGASGMETFTEGQGMGERIREWLDTPCGTVADKPSWGHNLATLKHEPTGPDLEVMAEMLIIEKIRRDIRDLIVTGVSVESPEIDRLYVAIDFTFGQFKEEVSL